MNYKRKNKDRIILLLAGVLLLLLLGIYFFQKSVYTPFSEVKVAVYPTVLEVGDTLYVKEQTPGQMPGQGIMRWEFGDGNFAMDQQGTHTYKKPGFYQVTFTINNRVARTVSVEVKPSSKKDNGDYFTTIDAPAEAMQYEHIIFRANTEKANLFSWKFGETGNIDAKEPFVIYTYQEPGEFQVYLYTDETAYPVIHNITIHPSFKTLTEELNVEEQYKAIDRDFKEHLQQIAQGASFNEHYNYLVRKYLCGNENAFVAVNSDKKNSFYYYCMGLRFDRNAVIQSVKVGFDDEGSCVTKVAVEQKWNER